jgi:hypothetical protein
MVLPPISWSFLGGDSIGLEVDGGFLVVIICPIAKEQIISFEFKEIQGMNGCTETIGICSLIV